MSKNRKERIENNVKIIYVWYILGRDREAANGYVECKFSVINVDDSCKNCGYNNLNFKVNIDKKIYKGLILKCFGKRKVL